MSRNELIQIKVTPAEKKALKQKAGNLDISKYLRNELFDRIDRPSENLEIAKARFKRVPDINRSVYVELSQISSELQQLGNWGEDLSERDPAGIRFAVRHIIANLRAKIAFLGLEAIGVKQEDSLDL